MTKEQKDTSDVVVQAGCPSTPDERTSSGSDVAPGLRNYGPTAAKIADKAFAKAKVLSGWRKWVAIVIGTLAAGAAAWLMAGCTGSYSQRADGSVDARWVIVLPVEGGEK